MRVLITGVTGFAGGHLAEVLAGQSELELFGLARHQWPQELRHLSKRVSLETIDLSDRAALAAALTRIEPQCIYHLAGYAQVGRSAREADLAWKGNLTATRQLYDAVVDWGERPRILFVGSGLVYESSASADHSHAEACPLEPATPYAASKSAADLTSYQFARMHGLDIIRARPFNHLGPRQSGDYAVPNFARQIAAIEDGRQPPVLETGNLSPFRDVSDVRDIALAYTALMKHGRPGEAYNICSGTAHSINDLLERLLALARVTVEVRTNPSLLRKVDEPFVRGDSSKLRRETGWAPRFSLNQTLADTLEYWRRRR
jgi:GDP-4-dehydro-6-deoxy-D-mannose reductase